MNDFTPVSWVIILLTSGLSLYAMYMNRDLYEKWILHPYSIINYKKYYMMITSGFLHADMMHLIFNMMTFYFFAFQLEFQIGSIGLFLVYFGSMILSNISTILKNYKNIDYRAVGASGAISGVLFSYILINPLSKIGIFLFPIGIPAPFFGLLYLAYCWWASKKSYDLINHEAHFYGALAGIIFTVILSPGVVQDFINTIF
jgi:membrane associated rhomboid family serine protease